VWYAVVSQHVPQETVEILPTRELAEAFITEVRRDEPKLADLLRIQPLDLGGEPSQN